MRVCLFCETWESGGIESFLTAALEAMDRDGLAFDVAACARRDSVFDRRLAALGVSVIPLSGSVRRLPANLRRFRALLRERRYEAVHLNLYEATALLYARAAKRAGVPLVIVHSHNSALRPSALRPAKELLHRLARGLFGGWADLRLAPSGAAAVFLFGQKPWSPLPNGIRPERFRLRPRGREAQRRALGLEGAFVVGCVGRLCAQKNQRFLLDVLTELPEAVLLLVGEGADEAMLRRRAAALGVDGRVRFCGTAAETPPLYWAMDAFCLPSRFEALGIAALEAQAAGLPTFCSDAVPPEAAVSGRMRRLPLRRALWAEGLAAARGAARTDGADVRAADCDVRLVAARLRALYAGAAP